MSKIPAINEIDANSPSQESKEVVVKATDASPDINEVQETISASATIQEVDGTRKPTISEIYKIVTDGLFESTSNWWDYAYKLSQAQINQDIIARLDKGEIGGGYSKGIDIITTTKYAVPTNANVYSALKSDSLYPKKLNDEKINGIYDFLNGIAIGNPTAYTGGTWSVNQDGKTSLTTDYLYVRLKAIFETLQILNVETIGGKMVISPAGSIKIVYVDEITITFEDIEQKAYRCYFLGEQEGEEIDNKWKVYDQAQAKSFNVKKGTYHKTGNHYLWRLVVGVSTDTVTIDGKKYHYVDLSQLVFDAGSDAPAPGDVLNQFGYRGTDDAQRQSALIFSAVDGNAPSITLYSGVNSFNLLNKEYVSFGVVNGKAFFKLYGDTYIGDRGENPNTYIKYHNGQLDIKANLDISSSIGGSSFEDYIKENAPGVDESQVINIINNSQVIKDLQNQADGAIETWFYEGEPTLKNLPAVDWTTNEIKKIHVGDLYYDQITGFAYRFTRYNDDVTPYAWNRIKDNDIVKALEAANKAQATADSKMKIFYGEIKPTDYQAGDMWVNATLAGKFDNDIARSTATSKTFDADHWVLASRYSEAIQSLLNWSNQYTTKFEDLTKTVKEQKDQSISNWFYDYEPTDSNTPANLWNTEELRKEHIGDIFYDTKNNHSYRWTGSAWVMIKDADFDEAMKKAKDAEDLADKKRQIFYSSNTPVGADRGDLWMRQVGTKTEVWVFDGTNWVKSDDKALADYSEAVNKELQGIKGQLDGKAETWYQADDPSTTWKDKTSHEGDIWYNTTDGTTQYWNGKAWEKMDIPKDVFDTIDGKSSIYVDSYADAKAGKGVISKGYDERDIWILPSDAVVNSTQYYKGDILTATANSSTFNEKHWVKKVRYVGEKELNSAVSVVQKQIDTINNTTLPNINKQFNDFVKDGILTTSEKARLKEALAALTSDKSKLLDSVAEVEKSEYLKNDTLVIPDLKTYVTALTNSFTEYESFVKTLIADSKTNITKTELATYQNNYTNLVNAINNVRYQITLCQSQIYKNIGADITTYKYLKEAIKGHTQINGGLVFTNVIQLRKTADVNSQVTAGISGLQAKTDANGNIIAGSEDLSSIAAWYGGPMVDRVTIDGVPSTWNEDTIKTDMGKKYAASIFRHDGSGYLAGGRIWWDRETGELHVNANSFIVNKDDLGLLATLFRLNLGTKYNIISAQPTAPFTNLTVLGSKTLNGITIGTPTSGGRIVIGNIVISNSGASDVVEISNLDGTKVANLGVSGGVSAYGTYTSSTGGGGGLNASVVSYASIIAGNYNDADLTTIPNAYSIKALYNAIQNIDVTGQLGNYLLKTDAADTYQPKGNYLTTHQTIYGLTIQKNSVNAGTYNPKTKAATINITVPTKISELSNDSGYTKNTGTVTSIGITVPTGLSVTGSPITTKGTIAITFAKGYSIPTTEKQTNWDSAYNWYSLMTTDEETADGIINKWNEVVDFLSNISQTNTLSGIIDGINKSITDETTRAKKAETNNTTNIGINKTNISTLQSYFSNGSAKKALQLTNARKLWGNSFNGLSDINGSIIVPGENYIAIGDVKLIYDATNKALKIDGNLYATGGVSAYGENVTTGGSGLNASVISYARILEGAYVDTDLTSIPNAYAIKALSSRIDNIATELGGLNLSWNNITDKPTSFTPSAHKHKWADITDRITKVSQLTNDAGYLTTHQSLANYYTKTEIDAKGYTTNKGTVTSVGLTLPTGLTCATKSITTSGTFAVAFTSGYSIPTTVKQTAWDGAVSAKHTHSNKSVLDTISSTNITNWNSVYDWYVLVTTDEETADGVINKWNEVVNFLSNIAQTDTLSGIIDGINTSISNEIARAKKAEGTNASNISANKTSITTLQGYFTNGSAKKALQLTTARKLWGNAFNGTTDINGSIVLPSGKYISIGNIKLEYDATNKALKITNTTTDEVANLYTSGGVSAYGIGDVAGSGGLQGSIISYADAITSDPGDEGSKIASASSIYKLHSRITDIEDNGATSISVTGTGNAITGVSKNGTDITFTKGNTFLTSHQSLANCVQTVTTTGTGNAVTAISKSGSTITVTKGTTFLTSHQSLASYYKKTEVDTIASGKSDVSHTHSVSINGVVKTIAATDGDAVNLGTYLTTHQSLAAYLKSADAAKTYASINHTHSVKINGTTKIIAASGGTAVDLGTYLTTHQSLDGYVNTLTQPTETNVFVTAISKNGKALTYTKSYTKKSADSATHSGWTNTATDTNIIPDMSFITYWNGAFNSGGNSNLKYCIKGAFGSFAIKNSLAFSELASKPTTIAGYGITDAYTKTQINTSLNKYLLLTGGTLSGDLVIGKIKFHYDSKNNAIAISHTDANTNANLYATGGITAYGEGTSASGGGLNGSVLSYESAIKLTSAGANELSQLASAWSIAKLNSRIVSLEGGSALDVVTSGTGNAVTAISKNGTTINVTKGTSFLTSHQSLANYLTKTDASNTYLTKTAASSIYQPKGSYLTAHQSLDGYVNNIVTSGAGNAITSVTKSGKTVTFTKGAMFLTSHQSLSAYLKSADAANTYLKLSGGAMTGNIRYKGSKNTYDMITFVDNNVDIYGNGICIGGGGLTIIGGGESASEVLKQHTNGGDEKMIVANDAAIDFFSNMNSGWDSRKAGSFDTSGYWNGVGFKKNNSNDNYVLTGGGGHKAISTLSVSYASSAGSANSVAWSNVSGRPTKVSQFTNDSNYATQSWVTGKGYLTSHQDISGKVNRTGDYLDTDSDRWWISNSEFGINLHNSDIVGVNSIYTSDVSNGPEESISFKRSNGNYDTLRMADGVIWFGTDYALNKAINEYQILHTNNISITGKSNGFIDMSAGGVIKQAYIYSIGSIDGYNSYPDGRTTSINDYDKGLNRLFLTHSTSSLPASQRPLGNDGHILHFGWDNSSGWDAQLAISANGDKPYIAVRAQYNGTWRNWYGAALLKFTNYITGNGGLMVERTDKNLDTYIGVSNGTYDIRLMIGSGNVNRGIYDVVRDNWMLYRDSSTNIYMNGNVLATGGITAYSSSDIRLKQDLRKLDYLGIIKAMGGTYGFAWKKDNTRSIGWIAQHVLCNPHLKDIVETDEKGYYKINYWSPKLIATAFGAIEQVDDEVTKLKTRVLYLEREIERLTSDK